MFEGEVKRREEKNDEANEVDKRLGDKATTASDEPGPEPNGRTDEGECQRLQPRVAVSAEPTKAPYRTRPLGIAFPFEGARGRRIVGVRTANYGCIGRKLSCRRLSISLRAILRVRGGHGSVAGFAGDVVCA